MREAIIRMVERSPSSTSQSGKPTIIKWHGCSMVRGHSINACVNEIIEFNKRRQFLKINIIGMSGTGKTTLMHVLSHQIHTASDIPYEVKFFNAEQLSNFKATVQGLSTSNQILCFDDLSGLVEDYGKKALDRLKAEMTTIRHINDQEDRKNQSASSPSPFRRVNHKTADLTRLMGVSNWRNRRAQTRPGFTE